MKLSFDIHISLPKHIAVMDSTDYIHETCWQVLFTFHYSVPIYGVHYIPTIFLFPFPSSWLPIILPPEPSHKYDNEYPGHGIDRVPKHWSTKIFCPIADLWFLKDRERECVVSVPQDLKCLHGHHATCHCLHSYSCVKQSFSWLPILLYW